MDINYYINNKQVCPKFLRNQRFAKKGSFAARKAAAAANQIVYELKLK